MKTIGDRIDFIRKQKGKSYRELAELIGSISGDAVRKAIRRNNLKDFYINIISEKLGINKDWILTGKGEKFISKTTSASEAFYATEKSIDKLIDDKIEGRLNVILDKKLSEKFEDNLTSISAKIEKLEAIIKGALLMDEINDEIENLNKPKKGKS